MDTGHPSNSPFNTIAQYSDAFDTPLKYVQYLQDGHLAKYLLPNCNRILYVATETLGSLGGMESFFWQ